MRLRVSSECVRVLFCATSLTMAWTASGHGWVTSPPSRQDHCARGRTSFDCGPVKYEPQSVEAPKGSWQCSGGSQFPILDQAAPWPVTSIQDVATFTWQLTAPHRTHSWEYFANGSAIQYVDGGNQAPPMSLSHTLSGLPHGRYTILARWNIADTPMAFYSCMDVQVSG
jgi:predicted carbohydrate-binding protein with CBM5 and CBM33 domain